MADRRSDRPTAARTAPPPHPTTLRPAPRRARRGLSSRTVTRIAFGVIVTFVLMQAAWWVMFQRGYVARISEERLDAWQRDATVAQASFEAAGRDAGLSVRLLDAMPHLTFDAEAGVFAVDPQHVTTFLDEQRGHLRMFAYEGPFFVLVILSMLALIARSLRQERAVKRSHQNFLSAVTHEFKTPVATLRLLIETAQLRDLAPARRRDYLDRMAGEVDRLERTADEVLAAARLEQAPLPMHLEAHDLRRVTRERLETLRPGLEARGARLDLDAGEGPLPVSLDVDAFALVLGNLLDNAVKYGPAGEKPVTVRLEGRGDVVALHVDDDGDGVPEAERARIFERFYRSGDESTRRATGVGLGLHLVRATVEAMNGWVRVAATPSGRGSRFSVLLPRRIGTEPAAAVLSGADVSADARADARPAGGTS